jgi:hypothetical protein
MYRPSMSVSAVCLKAATENHASGAPGRHRGSNPSAGTPTSTMEIRVNIAPVQRLGLLAANVLSAKDLKSLLAPEGRS